MPDQVREVSPGPRAGQVKTKGGVVLTAPASWTLLPPGDAALTRRVKSAGPHWVVKEKKGRRMFSRGVYAPTDRIEEIRAGLLIEREDPKYKRKLERARKKRAEDQEVYAEDFERAVLAYLGFAPKHLALAAKMARAIAEHATPVGSGTVARTKRIPIERRAEAATIAWMRHQTTAYDDMVIPRVKGARREARRMLAKRSKRLLGRYRRGEPVALACPLARHFRQG